MRAPLCFFFHYCHPTLYALVTSRTLSLFVLDQVHSLNLFSTIDTRNTHVRAYCFMTLDFLSDAFCLTSFISLTLDWLKFTVAIVLCYFSVLQNFSTSHCMVSTLKLHLCQLFLDFFLHRVVLCFLASHWAHSSFCVEFLQAFVVVSFLAFSAFNGLNQNGLTY